MRAALILILTASSPALGMQASVPDAGSLIRQPKPAYPNVERGLSDQYNARKTLGEFTKCAIARSTKLVKILIAGDSTELFDQKAYLQLATPQCLAKGALNFSNILFRGALFTELYRRSQERGGSSVLAKFPASPMSVRSDAPSEPALRQLAAALYIGECVARTDPEGAKLVVLAPTASPEQDAAFQRLAKTLGPCVPVGEQLRLNKAMLEGAIAEALYRPRLAQPNSVGAR